MANVKSIIAAHLSQRQRTINRQVERADLLDEDRLPCNIIRVATNINVPGRPGFVWCQEYSPSDDTSPFHAFNDKVQAREGLPVWVGPGLDGRREVLDWRNATIVNTADYNAQKYLPLHHTDHEWPDFKPGPDVTNIYPRALTMLRTYPGEAAALTVSASPLRYIKGNALVLFPGKNSLDISAAQPASGLARFVGIYLDPDDNTLKSVNGATTGDSPAITPDSPAFPESAILSANVRLDGDQTTFSEVDIVDVRQILDSSGAIDGTRVSKLVSPDGLTDPVLSVDNAGDIGAGVAPSSVAKFRLSDASGAQFRIEFDATHFADFEVDTNHDLTIKPSATGQVIFQPTTDSVDFFQILDADGGDSVFNVNSTDERVTAGAAGDANSISKFNVISDGSDLTQTVSRYNTDGTGAGILFQKSRGSLASPTTVVLNDFSAGFESKGYNGASFQTNALIAFKVAGGTVSGASMPGLIDFRTTPDGSNTPSVRMTIQSDGNIGIATAAPKHPLQVFGVLKVGGDAGQQLGTVALGNDATTTLNVGMFRTATGGGLGSGNFLGLGGFGGIIFTASATQIGSQTEQMRITTGGLIGINGAPAHVFELVASDDAAKTTTTTWTTTSDKRTKKNIKSFVAGTDYIKALPQVKEFQFNGAAGTPKNERGVGFLAQDLAKVAPSLVKYVGKNIVRGGPGKTKIATFNPHELIFALINTVVELDARIIALEP